MTNGWNYIIKKERLNKMNIIFIGLAVAMLLDAGSVTYFIQERDWTNLALSSLVFAAIILVIGIIDNVARLPV